MRMHRGRFAFRDRPSSVSVRSGTSQLDQAAKFFLAIPCSAYLSTC